MVQTFKFLHQLGCCQLSKKSSAPCSQFVIFSLHNPLQNGTAKQTASAKSTVTVSVNCQLPGRNISSNKPPHSYNSDLKVTNSTNKIHIESGNNCTNKFPVTSTENKTHVPGLKKPAI
jgi:hypothetical protein